MFSGSVSLPRVIPINTRVHLSRQSLSVIEDYCLSMSDIQSRSEKASDVKSEVEVSCLRGYLAQLLRLIRH